MRLQSLIRCVLCSVSLLASINFAQAFPCAQSMIAGKWIFTTIFRVASFTNPVGIACPIAIAPDGKTSTSGSCTAQPMTLLTSPSGKLLIDSSCKVTGPISWTACNPAFCTSTNTVVTAAVQLWRSFDGDRLSGFTSRSEAGGGSVFDIEVGPFELIYIPQPPP
jgi:hypothetical protein